MADYANVVYLVDVERLVNRWRHHLRRRLDERDVPALPHLVCLLLIVVAVGRLGVLTVPTELALPQPILPFPSARFNVYESPVVDSPEVSQCRILPMKIFVRGPHVERLLIVWCLVRRVRGGEH